MDKMEAAELVVNDGHTRVGTARREFKIRDGSASLKTVLAEIAPALGLPPDGMYETMRALMREGILERRAGHGPGSGVECTPHTLAITLAAYLTNMRPSDAAVVQHTTWGKKPRHIERPAREDRSRAAKFVTAAAVLTHRLDQ